MNPAGSILPVEVDERIAAGAGDSSPAAVGESTSNAGDSSQGAGESPASRADLPADLPVEVDVVVIGAGLMGAMTAMAASGRGQRVLIVERYAPGHPLGSSHGSARIIRRAYPDDFYVRLTGRAFELWTDLERRSGSNLLRMTGGLDHGPARDIGGMGRRLAAASADFELLDTPTAEIRWPGMRFEGDVLFHPQAGTVDCDLAVAAALSVARTTGAVLAHHTAVESIRVEGDTALVDTSRGTVRACTVVLAAGAWMEELAAVVQGAPFRLPPLRVSQQQVFHFARHNGVPEWPTSLHKGELSTYSLPGGRDGGPGGARKVAEHDAPASDTTVSDRSGAIDPARRSRIVDYVKFWMPGLVPEPFAEATCLYTSTENQDFLLDRVGPFVLCSPCSGHGAKFAPLIGEMTAELVVGNGSPEPRFTLTAHGF